MVMGDFNARIGNLPSTVDGKIWKRNSEDIINAEGREMIQKCDAMGLVILNGLREAKASMTRKGKSGGSVIDYVIVESGYVQEWGDVGIGQYGEGESDHNLLKVKWGRGMRRQKKMNRGRKKKGEIRMKKMSINRIKKDNWKIFQKEAEKMDNWVEWVQKLKGEEHIGVVYDRWLEAVKKVKSAAENRVAKARQG